MAMTPIIFCDEHKCPLETTGFCVLCGYCPDMQSTYVTTVFSAVHQLKLELLKTYEFIGGLQGLGSIDVWAVGISLSQVEQRLKELKRETNDHT